MKGVTILHKWRQPRACAQLLVVHGDVYLVWANFISFWYWKKL